jgi:AcrR family transcriptional regulator
MGNREALVEGALECLLEKGYARTTARDVAGRAGTSLAAIGYHFQSTDRLLQEAIGEGFRRWRERFSAVLVEHLDRPVPELLDAVGTELDRMFSEERRLMTVFAEALVVVARSPDLQAHAADLYEADRRAVADLVVAAGGRPEDARDVASLLMAVVDGLIVQTIIGGDVPTARRLLAVLAPALAALG